MNLSHENVESVFRNCLGETSSNSRLTKEYHGVELYVSFVSLKIEENRSNIEKMLRQIHRGFFADTKNGSGWSFLNFCLNQNNEMWTSSHRHCDYLVCLGLAIDKVAFCMDRKFWNMMTGSMPYLLIKSDNFQEEGPAPGKTLIS